MGGAELLLRRAAEAVVCDNAEYFAEFAVCDGLADLDAQRKVARPDGFHEEEFFLHCGVVEDHGLCGVDGEGLLAEDGFVVLETEHAVLEMVRVGRCDVDDVDV